MVLSKNYGVVTSCAEVIVSLGLCERIYGVVFAWRCELRVWCCGVLGGGVVS